MSLETIGGVPRNDRGKIDIVYSRSIRDVTFLVVDSRQNHDCKEQQNSQPKITKWCGSSNSSHQWTNVIPSFDYHVGSRYLVEHK